MGTSRLVRDLAVLALYCSPATAAADELGQRVRIMLATGAVLPATTEAAAEACGAGCRRVDGDVVQVRQDGTLLVRLNGRYTVVTVPGPAVRVMDVRRPRSTGAGALRGAALGALIGGAGGAVLGAALPTSCGGSYFCPLFTREEGAAIGGIFFGVIGTAAGALIGAVAPGGRWEYVPPRFGVTNAVRVSMVAAPGNEAGGYVLPAASPEREAAGSKETSR